jgi:hypothetical protein
MATWKKTDEVYFGDSFNRPSTIACYAANGDHLFDGKISACDLSYSPDSLTTANIDCSLNNVVTMSSHADALLGITGKADYGSVELCADSVALKTDIASVSSKLNELQAKIDNLERKKTTTSELRRALHTLNYKSEVERL